MRAIGKRPGDHPRYTRRGLVERGRLRLPLPSDQWLPAALAYPGVRLLDLTPDITADACDLPGTFHSDPADQIIVATARHHRSERITRLFPVAHATAFPGLFAEKSLPDCLVVHAVDGHDLEAQASHANLHRSEHVKNRAEGLGPPALTFR